MIQPRSRLTMIASLMSSWCWIIMLLRCAWNTNNWGVLAFSSVGHSHSNFLYAASVQQRKNQPFHHVPSSPFVLCGTLDNNYVRFLVGRRTSLSGSGTITTTATKRMITRCYGTNTNNNENDDKTIITDDASTTSTPKTTNNNEIEAISDTPLGRTLRGFVDTGMNPIIEKGAIVIAKADIPNLGIWMDQSYELQSIYWQGLNSDTQLVEKIFVDTLEEENSIPGYTCYITLYSPLYHDEQNKISGAIKSTPVKVTPEEVGLVSLRDEVMDSIVFALPVLTFWLTTSYVFVTQYNQRYGGNLMDALLGR